MAPKILQLSTDPIQDHCYSHDRKTLAITRDNSVEIYDVSGPKPVLKTVLKDHDKTVTAVDISIHGRIITCSQDRNALVWEPLSNGEYKPTLVLLRISRAATCARWSPNGFKFAVGSGDRVIAICYFEEENDWWVSKHIKKPLRSTVLSINWHPNNVLVAAGSTDGHARVFSAYIKGIDEKPEPSVWGDKFPFQTLCGDYMSSTGGWVHDATFSPSGDILAFVSHDSSVSIIYPSGPTTDPVAIIEIKTSYLPFMSALFISNNDLVVGGHNCNLVVYGGDSSGWNELYKLDESAKPAGKKIIGGGNDDDEMSSSDALNMFKQLDLKGKVVDKEVSQIFKNTVTQIRAYDSHSVSASSIDGKVVVFQLK